ncbi:MAG: beta-galactosidase [Motilibacteraceae bacterium]
MSLLFPEHELPISGEVQFWRMDPARWPAILRSVRELGITTVATYLSWRRHEPVEGTLDLRGGHGPELDVHRFLQLCHDNDLRVILKPGPWICAEETNGGLPDWLVADESLLARDWRGEPVSGYNPPFKHPMPSYASSRYRALVRTYLERVWEDLAGFTGEDGPVVGTQYDNEPSLGFQDTMYGFDYHPEAVRTWHEALGATPEPPRPRYDGPVGPTDLERSWQHWQRDYIGDYLRWIADLTRRCAPAVAGSVNLNTHPVRGWPQDGPTLTTVLEGAVVGEDHYFVPPLDEADIAGMAIAVAQARLSDSPLVWSPEIQAGIWRSPGEVVDYPDPQQHEIVAWWALALALGYQGFNLYMLADRDNWEFAPVDSDGAITPLGRALAELLQELRAVPGLSGFRPLTDAVVCWTDEAREHAYRVRGTQAHPDTPWDLPHARRAYEEAVAAVEQAVRRGYQVDLGPRSWTTEQPAVISDPGTLARVHTHPDGRRLLFLVRWSPGTLETPATVRLDGATALQRLGLRPAVIPIDRGSATVLPDGSVLQVFRITS